VPAYIDSIALNFITNALKCDQTKQKFLKFIVVDCILRTPIICFEDNGLGINKAAQMLFGMYETFTQIQIQKVWDFSLQKKPSSKKNLKN
jgi:hypothetical protein